MTFQTFQPGDTIVEKRTYRELGYVIGMTLPAGQTVPLIKIRNNEGVMWMRSTDVRPKRLAARITP